MLTAIATDAGTYPDRTVTRRDTLTKKSFTVEKGGWIELQWWETHHHTHETRYVQVTRERALEAMSNLAREKAYV